MYREGKFFFIFGFLVTDWSCGLKKVLHQVMSHYACRTLKRPNEVQKKHLQLISKYSWSTLIPVSCSPSHFLLMEPSFSSPILSQIYTQRNQSNSGYDNSLTFQKNEEKPKGNFKETFSIFSLVVYTSMGVVGIEEKLRTGSLH